MYSTQVVSDFHKLNNFQIKNTNILGILKMFEVYLLPLKQLKTCPKMNLKNYDPCNAKDMAFKNK